MNCIQCERSKSTLLAKLILVDRLPRGFQIVQRIQQLRRKLAQLLKRPVLVVENIPERDHHPLLRTLWMTTSQSRTKSHRRRSHLATCQSKSRWWLVAKCRQLLKMKLSWWRHWGFLNLEINFSLLWGSENKRELKLILRHLGQLTCEIILVQTSFNSWALCFDISLWTSYKAEG